MSAPQTSTPDTRHPAPSAGGDRRWLSRLPARVGRPTRVIAWLVLISNIVIVGTGGLVRLTGSGMGCETWPYCTPESLVPTQALGIHGLIEFGNRTLTGVLVIVALLAFLSVVRLWNTRPELPRLTLAVGIGIIVQAIIGGVTVWLHLHPSIVGVHYLLSAALVAISAAYVVRVYATPGPRERVVPHSYATLTHVTSLFVLVTVAVGILLTGSGPHAGDDKAARNGLDPIFWQHVHSWPAYTLFALTVVLFAWSFRTPPIARLRRWTGLLLGIELVQITVGLWQARTGLPIALVNIHMMLAVCLVAAMTAVVLHLKVPRAMLAVGERSTATS
ncbi:heme A synthase [Microbacterium sp. VKM Ac-2870]|uniref:COX15/CtaA family protein n=1 Tax=Microbacterium sp. VKM Ac-2870 TaxID=2783825 RepID=UPI00188A0042|nr:COX15/CtaA family protein [Microbacterium sp. VKM Ac-2870]MBF4561042.1 heme A synthase [Microbacterium sp. VKM Ac-2870]